MQRPLVSIIIPSYNYGRFLGQAIDSALNQTYPHTEVVVVDDGSVDDSREVIASYGDRIKAQLQDNRGEASAYNAGFRLSRGDVLCILDSDDALLPTAVEKAIELFRQSGVVKVHWPLWVIDQEGRRTGEIIPGLCLSEGDLREAALRLGPDSYVWPPTSGMAWTREFIESVFPIPEAEFRFGADAYLLALDPFFGTMKRVQEPHGLYRIHGQNHYVSRTLSERLEYDLEMFDHRCSVIAEYCRKTAIEVDPNSWKSHSRPYQLRAMIQELKSLVPDGDSFILVDHGAWSVEDEVVPGRRHMPFLERGGKYWGPPPDDATAIREVERLMRAGARYLVFARPAFWWLDFYAGWNRHLRANFPCVLENSSLVVFTCGER